MSYCVRARGLGGKCRRYLTRTLPQLVLEVLYECAQLIDSRLQHRQRAIWREFSDVMVHDMTEFFVMAHDMTEFSDVICHGS